MHFRWKMTSPSAHAMTVRDVIKLAPRASQHK
jgi:hypothetical protein